MFNWFTRIELKKHLFRAGNTYPASEKSEEHFEPFGMWTKFQIEFENLVKRSGAEGGVAGNRLCRFLGNQPGEEGLHGCLELI